MAVLNRDNLIAEFYDAAPPSNAIGLAVRVVGGGGGGGGGTEYLQDTVEGFITGTAILWEDAGSTVRVPSSTYPLPVSLAGTIQLGAGSAVVGRVILSDGVDDALISAAGRLQVELPAGGSGLTDAELRATPVPVSLPPGGSGLTDAELRAAAVPVSGAFFQATQPVSLAAAVDVSDRDARLAGRVKILSSAGAVIDPALGSQLPAALVGGRLDVNLGASGITLPVSLAAAVTLGAGSAQVGKFIISDGVDDALVSAQGALYVGGVAAHDAVISGNPVMMGGRASDSVPASVSADGDVVHSWFTREGAQVVHLLRDALRVNKTFRFTSTTAAAADTLLSLTPSTDGVDGGAATTHAVTAGKRLRLTHMTLTLRTTTAANPWGLVSLRMNPAGAAVIGSPVAHWLGAGGTAAVAGNVASDILIFPDGWELSGTMQLGISFANNVNTNVTNIVLHGYEYTP